MAVSKAQMKRIAAFAENQQKLATAVDSIILAQNHSGVLVMTLLQMLIEKGLFSEAEIQQRLTVNEAIALDNDGGCKIALRELLHSVDGDEDDEAAGSEGESS